MSANRSRRHSAGSPRACGRRSEQQRSGNPSDSTTARPALREPPAPRCPLRSARALGAAQRRAAARRSTGPASFHLRRRAERARTVPQGSGSPPAARASPACAARRYGSVRRPAARRGASPRCAAAQSRPRLRGVPTGRPGTAPPAARTAPPCREAAADTAPARRLWERERERRVPCATGCCGCGEGAVCAPQLCARRSCMHTAAVCAPLLCAHREPTCRAFCAVLRGRQTH